MARMQIQFTEEQQAELRHQARKRGISISAFVREAVDRELGREESLDEAWARALSVVGSGRGDGTNVAERHDEFLAEAFAHD
jgi:Arc/MetJ-type ribon-helix-helix transcriptional regulator